MEMDSFVFAALCIIIVPLSRREEGRRGEGRKLCWKKSNCLSRQYEVKSSGFREAGQTRGAALWLHRGNTFMDLFSQPIYKDGDGALNSDLYRALSLTFFSTSCHVEIITPVMGWAKRNDHPPPALIPLTADTPHRGGLAEKFACTPNLSPCFVFALFTSFLRGWLLSAPQTRRRPPPPPRPAPACWADVWGMASAVFEGTSLVNMFVRDCWVNGIRRLIISQRGEEEEFFEIRTEWSDRNILYLHRSYSDLGRLFKRLVESFPEDRRDLSKSPLIEGMKGNYKMWQLHYRKWWQSF